MQQEIRFISPVGIPHIDQERTNPWPERPPTIEEISQRQEQSQIDEIKEQEDTTRFLQRSTRTTDITTPVLIAATVVNVVELYTNNPPVTIGRTALSFGLNIAAVTSGVVGFRRSRKLTKHLSTRRF